MLSDDLPAHQRDHAKQRRTQYQLAVAIGLEQLPGKIGDDQPQEGNWPHHCRGHGNAHRYPQQQLPHAAIIVHPQIDSLGFAEGEHIQKGQFLSKGKYHARQHQNAECDDLAIDV